MDDLPARRDPRSLRASDADRERVAELLREAAADGRLTFAELDERLDAAYAAKTYAELDVLTGDLATLRTTPVPEVTATRSPRPAAVSVAFMSGAKRAGRWVVPPRYTAVAVMGGVELDLRYATFGATEVTIQAFCLMGGVQITVPEHLEVDVTGFAFMGGFDHQASGPGAPGSPRLRVTGFALMGGVEVRRRPAGEPHPPRAVDGPDRALPEA